MTSMLPSGERSVNRLPRMYWAPGSLSGTGRAAETIAARDLNNLYRVSCYFRERERYRAFCALYAVMRVVDDRVDELLAQPRNEPQRLGQTRAVVSAWHRVVRSCLEGIKPGAQDLADCDHRDIDDLVRAFAEAVARFPVPTELWDCFFAAMLRDLQHDRFGNHREFLDYAAGAAVTPTTIYLCLITTERPENGSVYSVPEAFDVIRCGRALGRFAYLAHILRDLRQDLMSGEEGMCYIALEDMSIHGVTEESLRREARDGTSSSRQRALMRDLAGRAWTWEREGRSYLRTLDGRLGVDRTFVLEYILRIYEGVLRKIAHCSYDVMSERHLLTEGEKERIGREIAASL